MKASMLTIITLLALSIGNLLGGTAIVENIFMWDGVGKLAEDAIAKARLTDAQQGSPRTFEDFSLMEARL